MSGQAGNSPMMTVREAAQVLRLNVKTVYAECDAGRLQCRRFGRSIRIPRAVVEELVRAQVRAV